MGLKRTDPADLVELLSGPDAATPVDADGKRRCVVRCRVPFVFDAGVPRHRPHPEPMAARAVGDGEGGAAQDEMIEGVASSTSVDWYGTRMTKDCLESMATQFRSGVDYLPRHHSMLDTIEWDGVIGRTVGAEVKRAEVREPKEGEDARDQWILTTQTRLYSRKELARELVACIDEGRAPGQSIGGWFTQVSVTYDEDGWVVYPIDVLAVELDHLAAVRCPANPDAERVWVAMREKLDAAGRSAFAPGQPTARGGGPVPTTDNSLRAPSQAVRSVPNPGEGATAPAPEPEHSQQRAMESEMDPKQFEEMMARALAPLVAKIGEIDARTQPVQAAPAATPAPAPAASERAPDMADFWRARAMAAEATASAMVAAAASGTPVGQRAAAAPDPAAPARSEIPLLFRSRTGADLRTAAPRACKEAQRVGAGEVTGDLVLRFDGMKGLAQFAQVNGESRAVSELVLSQPGLQETSFVPRELRKRSKEDLQSLLSDVIFAGIQDGLVGQKAASWN